MKIAKRHSFYKNKSKGILPQLEEIRQAQRQLESFLTDNFELSEYKVDEVVTSNFGGVRQPIQFITAIKFYTDSSFNLFITMFGDTFERYDPPYIYDNQE